MRQGNALIAEACFEAAIEKTSEAVALWETSTRRLEVLMWRCRKHKADLLVKWEKRESQGVEMLESLHGKYDLNEIADASELFIPPPALDDIEKALAD
jgi:hypothetical protein